MKSLNPYLSFTGNCEEALNFYKEVFGGEIVELNRYAEMPDSPESYKDKILHAHLMVDDLSLMCSDSMPEYYQVQKGNDVTLMLGFDDEAEQTNIFNALSQGGTVTLPLEDTFWQARFGSLIDKYGFNWSLNCDKK